MIISQLEPGYLDVPYDTHYIEGETIRGCKVLITSLEDLIENTSFSNCVIEHEVNCIFSYCDIYGSPLTKDLTRPVVYARIRHCRFRDCNFEGSAFFTGCTIKDIYPRMREEKIETKICPKCGEETIIIK